MQVETECPLCESMGHHVIGVNPDFAPSQILACSSCGFMRTSPMPSEVELANRYRQEYRELRGERITDLFLAARDLRAEAQRDFILDSNPQWRNSTDLEVMDVGCAAGSLLDAFAMHARTLIGYEPDEQMAAAARRRLAGRAEIRNQLLEPPATSPRRFDLICMSHALEHTCDPIKMLRQLFQYCHQRGCVFLEVPNESDSTVRALCTRGTSGVFHLLFFKADDLRRCIERAGGEVRRLGTYGNDLHPPSFFARGGMRRLIGGISRRLLREERVEMFRIRRAMFYENPRESAWLRCLCAPHGELN